MHNCLVIVIILISGRRNDQSTDCAEGASQVLMYLLAARTSCCRDNGWRSISNALCVMKVGDIDWIWNCVSMVAMSPLLWLACNVLGISLWGVVILQIWSMHGDQVIALSGKPTHPNTPESILILSICRVLVLSELLLVCLVLSKRLLLFVCDLDLLWVHLIHFYLVR